MIYDNKNCLDKSKCFIKICDFSDIRHIFNDFHYKKDSMGGGISVCFAMFYKGKLVGGSVLGKPRHEKKYKNCIDIRRMACIDESPFNSESYFLGQIIKWITSNTDYNFVLSYSDLTVNHIGTIYKASNFKFIGETLPTKYIDWNGKIYHPRSLSIDRDYSRRLNEDLNKGLAEIKEGLPKKIWIYEVNKNKRSKKTEFLYFNDDINQQKLF